MNYNWSNISKVDNNLEKATVGYQVSGKDYDLSLTGRVFRDNSGHASSYKVVVNGVSLWISGTGVVLESLPADAKIPGTETHWVGQSLQIVTANMGEDNSVGSTITRQAGSTEEEGGTNEVALTTMEPRDYFAMNILNAMLIHAGEPESFDDASCLYYCRSAYRWAQAMVTAAADSRNTKSSDSAIDIENATTSEQLLNSIVTSINNLNSTMGGTLKVDNPLNDKFDVEGGGGGVSLNRDDVNDSAQAVTDFIIYNTAAGKAPMRVTLANAITKILASLDATQKQTLYNALKDKMDEDYDAKGSADTAKQEAIMEAVAQANSYTDTEIAKIKDK